MPKLGMREQSAARAGAQDGASSARARLIRAAAPLLLVATAIEGSACAMQPSEGSSLKCTVEGAAKLPAELGSDEAICAPIARAVQDAAKGAGLAPAAVSVRVRVLSADTLEATTMVNGTALPAQKLRSSDRAVTRGSIERFAGAVARQLAEFAAARR